MSTVIEQHSEGRHITFTHGDNDDLERDNQWMDQLAKKHGVSRDELVFVSEQDWRTGGYISLEELNERNRDGKDGVPIQGTIHLIRRPQQ